MFSVKEVAEKYGVRESTVLAWIHCGDLESINVAESRNRKSPRHRITDKAIAAFELLRSSKPTPKIPRRKNDFSDVDPLKYA